MVAAETLHDQHKFAKFTTGKAHISQWDLVINGTAIARQTTPDMWTKSYRKVNLDPHSIIKLTIWCEKTKHFLSYGGALKEEGV